MKYPKLKIVQEDKDGADIVVRESDIRLPDVVSWDNKSPFDTFIDAAKGLPPSLGCYDRFPIMSVGRLKDKGYLLGYTSGAYEWVVVEADNGALVLVALLKTREGKL